VIEEMGAILGVDPDRAIESEKIMHNWHIFKEDENTGDQTFLGEFTAATMAEALQQAAEYFECDSGDLVAVQRDDYFTYESEDSSR
jgi:hypothetical protein